MTALTVDVDVTGGRALLEPTELTAATGWELKPEGLCREDVCVPVRDRDALLHDGRIDLGAVADALDRPFALDADAGVAAMGEPRALRRQAATDLIAPSFELPHLAGERHTLEEWNGQKRLLFAFASW